MKVPAEADDNGGGIFLFLGLAELTWEQAAEEAEWMEEEEEEVLEEEDEVEAPGEEEEDDDDDDDDDEEEEEEEDDDDNEEGDDDDDEKDEDDDDVAVEAEQVDSEHANEEDIFRLEIPPLVEFNLINLCKTEKLDLTQ